jgi:hypothetical protein
MAVRVAADPDNAAIHVVSIPDNTLWFVAAMNAAAALARMERMPDPW